MSKFRFHYDADVNAAAHVDASDDMSEAARAIASHTMARGKTFVGAPGAAPFLQVTRDAAGRLQSSATRALTDEERALRAAIDRWTPPSIGERLRDAFSEPRVDTENKTAGDQLADFLFR